MIRAYRPADLPELRRICLLTRDAGADATGLWSDDGLLPDLYLEPYLVLPGGWGWVAEIDGAILGYLVATLDTREFVSAWRQRWSPEFDRRHPHIIPGQEWMHDRAAHPEQLLVPEVDQYPVHLHVDLLPAAQGRGLGREFIATLAGASREAGAGGIHLGFDPANSGARGFYEKLGFTELPSSTVSDPLFGMRVQPSATAVQGEVTRFRRVVP